MEIQALAALAAATAGAGPSEGEAPLGDDQGASAAPGAEPS
jgi:hypothetical protein